MLIVKDDGVYISMSFNLWVQKKNLYVIKVNTAYIDVCIKS